MKILKSGVVLTLCIVLGACGAENPAPVETAPAIDPVAPAAQVPADPGSEQPGPVRAVVELKPTEGSSVHGTLTFTVEEGGLRLSGSIDGLEPGSVRGFHLHEFGDCSAPDAMSAGGHWNPQGHEHGRRSHGVFHAGDMDNLVADATGSATVDYLLEGLEIGTGSALDVVGRSAIVHKGTDDYVSQPTGDAGARAACGTIELRSD